MHCFHNYVNWDSISPKLTLVTDVLVSSEPSSHLKIYFSSRIMCPSLGKVNNHFPLNLIRGIELHLGKAN